MVATYRSSDTDPKERFVHQQAGDGGFGDSSYIDLMAFREKDANTAWTSASDGTLEERLYYCQNQHADVVALVTSAGGQREMDRYSAYGVPFGLPMGDSNSDGLADASDRTTFQGWINSSAYVVRGDVDLDGDVDINDKNAVSALGAVTLGRGALSAGAVGNQRGVAGYENGVLLAGTKYRVRNRALEASLGQWNRRDPLDSFSASNLLEYVNGQPTTLRDPHGLKAWKEVPCGTTDDKVIPIGQAVPEFCHAGTGLEIIALTGAVNEWVLNFVRTNSPCGHCLYFPWGGCIGSGLYKCRVFLNVASVLEPHEVAKLIEKPYERDGEGGTILTCYPIRPDAKISVDIYCEQCEDLMWDLMELASCVGIRLGTSIY